MSEPYSHLPDGRDDAGQVRIRAVPRVHNRSAGAERNPHGDRHATCAPTAGTRDSAIPDNTASYRHGHRDLYADACANQYRLSDSRTITFSDGSGAGPLNRDGRNGCGNTNAFPIAGPPAGPVDTLGIAEVTNDARVPVFINTNRTGPVTYDFRWWIDLNRNRTNEPATNGLTTVQPGEPEWLGVLEYPYLPHSRTNKFLYRCAFMALPATKSLDVNYVHNFAKRLIPSPMPFNGPEAFLRNQGFGNWEYNLAGRTSTQISSGGT